MLGGVALVRSDISKELSASFVRVTRIGELGTTLITASVVCSSLILVTLMKEALRSSEMSVLTRATWRNIPADAILHQHEIFINYTDIDKFCTKHYCNNNRLTAWQFDVTSNKFNTVSTYTRQKEAHEGKEAP
jgi:hypothetical protein